MNDYKNTPEYMALSSGETSDIELRLMFRNATQFDTAVDNVAAGLSFAEIHKCPLILSYVCNRWEAHTGDYRNLTVDVFPARAVSRTLLMWMIVRDGAEVVKER